MSHKASAAPVIGLPVQIDSGENRQYLDRHYADALAAAGASPILVPLLKDTESLRTCTMSLDGILLTGSNRDVDPARYGAEMHARCGLAEPLRDETDLFLLSAARERRMPVLAICFGIQSLNVFMGGTLIQDIPTWIDSPIQHSRPDAEFAHPIHIVGGSLLDQLAAGGSPMVNSTHHQAIERVGQGLVVIARAPDGIIESVASTQGQQWILGVQWHPEESYDYDEFSRKIFGAFVSQCRFS